MATLRAISPALLAPPIFGDCPGCHSDRIADRFVVSGYTLTKCENCSLVFVRERVSAAALEAHYAVGLDGVYDDDNRECLSFYYNNLKRQINRRVPSRGAILDVGCAGGWFLDGMQGWECFGCEPSPRAYAVARKKHGERIRQCLFEEYPAVPNRFDVISMQDVFDHLPEPAAALGKCWDMLRPGGLLAIKVHDISCLYAQFTGKDFYALIPPSHLFYYSRRSLTTMLQRAGFDLVAARHMGHILKVKTVFHRLARGSKESIYYRIFQALNSSSAGNLKIYKNLHDIVTVFAVKRPDRVVLELKRYPAQE